MTVSPRDPHRWVWAAGLTVWLAATAAGLWTLWLYANTPGTAAVAPATWPGDATLSRAADRPTVVLLAHPQCSCTTATLTELAEALARAKTLPRTYVLFLKPYGVPDGWEQSSLWRTAAALPGVTVVPDDNGTEAARFGASTSGQVVAYDADGVLRFSGGITGARGHAGDNAGRAALVALLNGTSPAADHANVFGCALFADLEGRL